MSLTNYVAFTKHGSTQSCIGHLNLETQVITQLSFASGTPLHTLYEVIEVGEKSIVSAGEELKISDVKLLPPISGRDVLAVGKNYSDHAKEFHASGYDSSDKTDQPSHPVIFTKRSTSIVAHGDAVLSHPGFTESVDYEGEIGVIIGKPGFRISEADAMDHVWGYTIINDVTARERQRDHKQFFIGKSPDTYCPMGPIAVPKENLPKVLEISTFINGERRQNATTKDLIFSVPFLIKTMSEGQTLQLGDVLATGTPAGVGFGFKPMKFLQPGDEMKVTVSGLGSLVNKIAKLDMVNDTPARVEARSHIPVANEKTLGGIGLTKVGNKQLYYRRVGSDHSNGTQVLFVHGLGGSSEYFTPLVAKLTDTDKVIYLADLEGHGLSPTSALSKLTIETFAADLYELVKQQSISSGLLVVAHSMGCHVAVQLALQHPELVSKLVLMGPPPSPLPEAGATATHDRAKLVRSKGMSAIVEAVVKAGLSQATHADNQLAVTATRLSLLGQDPEGYAKACVALASAKELAYKDLKCPTLILTGADDKVSPPALCEKYGSQISQGTVEVVENVGHWHLFESPSSVSQKVVQFLG